MKFIYFTASLLALGTLNTTVEANENTVRLNCPGQGNIDCSSYDKDYKTYICKASSGKAKWTMNSVGIRSTRIEKEIEVVHSAGLAGKHDDTSKQFRVTGCLYKYANKDGTKHKQPALLGMYPEGYNRENGWNCHAETLDLNVIECDPIENK